MKKKKMTAWDIAPTANNEGTITGTVVRIRQMDYANGCQLLVRIDGSGSNEGTETPDIPDWMSPELYRMIHKEQADSNGAVKIGIYFSRWKYDVSDPQQTEIQDLLIRTRPGHIVTIRIGKNWQGRRCYCRYIKNETTGERAGYTSESEWRTAEAAPPFPETGTHSLKISRVDEIEDGWQRLTVIRNGSRAFDRYRVLVAPGSDAAHTLAEIQANPDSRRSFTITLESASDSGEKIAARIALRKTWIEKNEEEKQRLAEQRNAAKRNRPPAPRYDFAFGKELAETQFDNLKNCDYMNDGVYDAEVIDHPNVNFLIPTICHVPLRLANGREIMPEFRKRRDIGEAATQVMGMPDDSISVFKNSRMIFPGEHLHLYFKKNRERDGNLILQAAFFLDAEEALYRHGIAYIRKVTGREPDAAKTAKANFEALWKKRYKKSE